MLLRELTLAISGQNNLAASKHHQDPKINPKCELCSVKENSEHVILYCPRLDEVRYRLNYQNVVEEVYGDDNLDWNKFTKLIHKSKLYR